ncbi:hypothetical protein LTR78_009999 [Recurvomyces mirabilis]|uniref:Zn(2)-C6 fungal-type domain-containing protein n=1 Tax=Recurvomyces mirabilis TaxID=574656 RepID=A0AAE0TQW0_9PEZI|nr:hypothetical protein LTR78_009999 [Recurvomyces mirabilis]KAK5160340.1 hypothetical protein LTS14_001352 [Recurvomyces mirabilis]
MASTSSSGPYFDQPAQRKRPAPDNTDGRIVRTFQQDDVNVEPSLQHILTSTTTTTATTAGAELAAQACTTCRKQKRKCDKILPSCGLCIRIGRPCDYSDEIRGSGAAPSPEDFVALRQEVAELKNLLSQGVVTPAQSNGGSNGHNNSHGSSPYSALAGNGRPMGQSSSSFPSLYFLDSNAFEYERSQIQAPYIRPPPSILACLGNSLDLRGMIEHYFDTVHTYFPIISKIRLYQHLANPLHEPGADIALLFSAMKLACLELAEGEAPQTQLYLDVKSAYTHIESQNGFSIQLIQALLLISLYETGHAIYPAAYLTIGHAARLGHAMGIHERNVPQILQRPTTWTEQEERRRVWWAVILLDRFISIGSRGKPFASADPSLDTHLPTDDTAWDKGHMLVAAPLALSASATIRAAPFARTCQAAHLLGKILRHTSDTGLPLDYRFDEALQLNKTCRALATLLPDEAEAENLDAGTRATLCSSMGIAYSALFVLYDTYSCTERAVLNGPEAQLVMQKAAIEGLSEFSAIVMRLARHVRYYIETEGLVRLPVFVIDSFYQAAANYAWYVRESSDPVCGKRLQELKELLGVCEKRWRVAGQYSSLVSDFWQRFEFSTVHVVRDEEGNVRVG